jgi:hypothetical protein
MMAGVTNVMDLTVLWGMAIDAVDRTMSQQRRAGLMMMMVVWS